MSHVHKVRPTDYGGLYCQTPGCDWELDAYEAAPIFVQLLEACEATRDVIEFRGKSAMASFDELLDDESNWQDGVEPYLLEMYNQVVAAIAAVRGVGGALDNTSHFTPYAAFV